MTETDRTQRDPQRVAPLSPTERLEREAIELREQIDNQRSTIDQLRRALDAQELAIERSATTQARALELADYRTRRGSWTWLSDRVVRLGEQLARARSGCRRLRAALNTQAALRDARATTGPAIASPGESTRQTLLRLTQTLDSEARALVAFVLARQDPTLSRGHVKDRLLRALKVQADFAVNPDGKTTTAENLVAGWLEPLVEPRQPAKGVDEQGLRQRLDAGRLTPTEYAGMLREASLVVDDAVAPSKLRLRPAVYVPGWTASVQFQYGNGQGFWIDLRAKHGLPNAIGAVEFVGDFDGREIWCKIDNAALRKLQVDGNGVWWASMRWGGRLYFVAMEAKL